MNFFWRYNLPIVSSNFECFLAEKAVNLISPRCSLPQQPSTRTYIYHIRSSFGILYSWIQPRAAVSFSPLPPLAKLLRLSQQQYEQNRRHQQQQRRQLFFPISSHSPTPLLLLLLCHLAWQAIWLAFVVQCDAQWQFLIKLFNFCQLSPSSPHPTPLQIMATLQWCHSGWCHSKLLAKFFFVFLHFIDGRQNQFPNPSNM